MTPTETTATAPAPLLAAHGLSTTGPHGPVFTDLSLVGRAGELIAVTGEPGTGRTTALLALAGRHVCRTGTLAVERRHRPAEIRRRVSVAVTTPAVDRHHSVGQLITETAVTHRVTPAAIRAALRRLDRHIDPATVVADLPADRAVVLSLALAAAGPAPVVVRDDLDHGLSPAAADRVWRAARAVADTGRLVIVSTTDPAPPADRIVPLRSRRAEPNR